MSVSRRVAGVLRPSPREGELRWSDPAAHRHNTSPDCEEKTSKRPTRFCGDGNHRRRTPNGLGWPVCWLRTRNSRTLRPAAFSGFTRIPSGTGASAGARRGSPFETNRDRGARRFFPPRQIVGIKAVACELPAQHDLPLSRLFIPDIVRIVTAEKIVESISPSTVWRILDADALKPWRRRSWIWSRDPLFFERAAPVLDLYQGLWRGRRLREDEFVICADEKTSIQARCRLHPSEVHSDGRGQRVEHQYERKGAWTYLAALEIFTPKIIGRVEAHNGIVPFDRLVHQVMTQQPYASARRVFWIVDQGSSHRPTTFPDRLRRQFKNAVAVVLPVHASWLDQAEIYFSILERKALTPNDFPGLPAVAHRIAEFQRQFNRTAFPFDWTFTREHLKRLLARVPQIVLTMDAMARRRRVVA